MVVLGTSGFNEQLGAIDDKVRDQVYVITVAKERIEFVRDADDPRSVKERMAAEWDLQMTEDGLKELRALRRDIATHWGAMERRVFRELAWASPTVLSTDPGQYTLDLAVIKIDADNLDANNYGGNSINIGNKYTRKEFMGQG